MSKHKRHHSTRTMKKSLQHWTMAKNGPFAQPLARKKNTDAAALTPPPEQEGEHR